VEAEALSWQYVGLGRVIHIAAPITYQLRYRNGDGITIVLGTTAALGHRARNGSGSKSVRSHGQNQLRTGRTAQIAVRLSETTANQSSSGFNWR
jgi:hypothetical protein